MRVANPSRAVSFGTDPRAFNARMFLRLCAWGSGAALALVIAVAAGRTELGARRAHAALTAMLSGPATPDQQFSDLSERMTAWSDGLDQRMRGQAETIRALTDERDDQAAKLSALERQIGELGGTLARTTARLEAETKAAQQAAASAASRVGQARQDAPDNAAPAASAPAPALPAPPAAATRPPASRDAARLPNPPNSLPLGQIRSATPTAGFPVATPDSLLAAPAYTGTIPMPAPPENAGPAAMIRPFPASAPPSDATTEATAGSGGPIPLPRPNAAKLPPTPPAAPTRAPLFPSNPLMTTGILDAPIAPDVIATEFAIDLGAAGTVEAARLRWNELRASQSPLFDNLKPLISLKDGGRSGQELHLVAGPLSSTAMSARLCAVLAGTGISCRPAAFEGQRLATR
jgi:hypothetical protein